MTKYNLKQYTLDDGTITDANKVAAETGITIKNARIRLSKHSSREKVFKDKQQRSSETYKMRKIMSRGMFDEMYVKAFKSI
jgi:polysaccharide deacetylase 2 family uncharacterized protein YibQ